MGKNNKIIIKIHNIDNLLFNRFLVFDFDYMYLTGLHWACKRGFFKVAAYLIDKGKIHIFKFNKKGAYVNSEDIIGRTPLYYAIMN